MREANPVPTIEQGGLFPDIPVSPWNGRRFIGRQQTMGGGGMTAAVRLAVFTLCRKGQKVTTDSTGHPLSRVRNAFKALARERLIKLGRRPCRNPHGYRLVARLHPRLKHLREVGGRKAEGGSRYPELEAIRRPGRQSYFAAPCADWDAGWYGRADTPEGAIALLLEAYEDARECVVAIGYRVTKRRYPDLFDGPDSLSEYPYQIERPYVRVILQATDAHRAPLQPQPEVAAP